MYKHLFFDDKYCFGKCCKKVWRAKIDWRCHLFKIKMLLLLGFCGHFLFAIFFRMLYYGRKYSYWSMVYILQLVKTGYILKGNIYPEKLQLRKFELLQSSCWVCRWRRTCLYIEDKYAIPEERYKLLFTKTNKKDDYRGNSLCFTWPIELDGIEYTLELWWRTLRRCFL